MVLFSAIVVFMATIWGQHAHVIGKSRSRMTAAFIAEQVTETFIAKGYAAALGESTAVPGGSFNMTTIMRGQTIVIPYFYTVNVTQNPSNPLVGVLKVAVRFPDEQKNSTFKEIEYETFLAKPH